MLKFAITIVALYWSIYGRLLEISFGIAGNSARA
jgi:hypothetical protein